MHFLTWHEDLGGRGRWFARVWGCCVLLSRRLCDHAERAQGFSSLQQNLAHGSVGHFPTIHAAASPPDILAVEVKVKDELIRGRVLQAAGFVRPHTAQSTHTIILFVSRRLLQARAQSSSHHTRQQQQSEQISSSTMSEGLQLGNNDSVHSSVSKYYGETLQGSSDLKTSACCTSAAPPPEVRSILAQLPQDITSRCVFVVGAGC